MSLKAQLPSFEKGSADLGGQLRQLLAVVVQICEAIEAESTPDETPVEAPADEKPADEAPAEPAKPATKPAAKATAAK